MEKIEKPAVIKYLFIKGMSTKKIFDDMFVTFGDDGPSYSAVKNWVAEFKRGRSSIVDQHRSGCPKDATSAENIQIINDMLNKDRHLTIRHIVETTSINCSTVHRIVSEDLGMRKVLACWCKGVRCPPIFSLSNLINVGWL